MTDGPYIDRDSGEVLAHAPSYAEALERLHEAEMEYAEAQRDIKGKHLTIRQLRADRAAKVMADPRRQEVEVVHACWRAATNRRRDLDWPDRERISRALKHYGLRYCLQAVAGAVYDPNVSKPRRNGKRERYDDLELIFRELGKVESFATRAPKGYEPKPEKVAELSGQPLDWIEERLR